MSEDIPQKVQIDAYNHTEIGQISATTTEAIKTLDYKPDEILIYNSGTDDVYINLDGVADSTNGFLINAGASLTISAKAHNIHVIAAATTATVFYIACRHKNVKW